MDIADAITRVWTERTDRCSEIRSTQTAGLQRIEIVVYQRLTSRATLRA